MAGFWPQPSLQIIHLFQPKVPKIKAGIVEQMNRRKVKVRVDVNVNCVNKISNFVCLLLQYNSSHGVCECYCIQGLSKC